LPYRTIIDSDSDDVSTSEAQLNAAQLNAAKVLSRLAEERSEAGQQASDRDQDASEADQLASDDDEVAAQRDQATTDRGRRACDSDDDADRSYEISAQQRAASSITRRRGAATRVATATARAAAVVPDGEDAPDTRDVPADDIIWLRRIRRALTEDRYVLYAQPIIALDSRAVVHCELLIRMIGEDGTLVPPGDFLPTAERCGVVSELDRWVLGRAMDLAAQGYPVQVNISGTTLADPDIAAFVERELVRAGAKSTLVGFEITETALISNEALAAAFVQRVRALGCQVALDDFGTGFAGLAHLRRFPVDCLKIDREFVADLLVNHASELLVLAIVHLAAGFGLATVAEGVEDEATGVRLHELGVSHGQGYWFACPAPAVEVLRDVAALATS
jgi:EAL domain-containing protein (putative c-di-GMP-specific phosphodiesterase class I)